jgi:hypothetical protein
VERAQPTGSRFVFVLPTTKRSGQDDDDNDRAVA